MLSVFAPKHFTLTPSHSFAAMLYYVWLLSILVSLCNAAALPQLREKHLNPRLADSRISEHRLANKYARRSGQDCGVSVSLELLDSGYIGNISIGSQGESVPTLFDLNASQLSALSPTVQYCSGSDDCTPRNNHINGYNPSLSHSSKNLSTTFEVIVSNATFTGVLYQDSISIGGISLHNVIRLTIFRSQHSQAILWLDSGNSWTLIYRSSIF